ncbi:MAG: DUF1640 domain-containing protein [SAR324 cluster bacterium]|nr:DUF1640 domain-containing protein [SAR324 cluster bacterium]MBF0349510.1 DUF1640 domain-containing protein [SAR324 cluster bacterium]
MLVFDTLQFYNRLEKAGFTKDQAEIVTELVKETQEKSFESISENLATKDELRHEINQAKLDLIKWIITLLLAQTGIIAALVKLL